MKHKIKNLHKKMGRFLKGGWLKGALLLTMGLTPSTSSEPPWVNYKVDFFYDLYSYVHPYKPLSIRERLNMPMEWKRPWKDGWYIKNREEFHERVEKPVMKIYNIQQKMLRGKKISLEEWTYMGYFKRKWEELPPIFGSSVPFPLFTRKTTTGDVVAHYIPEIIYEKRYSIKIPAGQDTLYILYATPGLHIVGREVRDTSIYLKKLGEVKALKLVLYTKFDEKNPWTYHYSPLGAIFWYDSLVKEVDTSISIISNLMMPSYTTAFDFYSLLLRYASLVNACQNMSYVLEKVKRDEELFKEVGVLPPSPKKYREVLEKKCSILDKKRSITSRMGDFTRGGYFSLSERGKGEGFVVAQETIDLENNKIATEDYTPLMLRTNRSISLPTIKGSYYFVDVWSTLRGDQEVDTITLYYVMLPPLDPSNPEQLGKYIDAEMYYSNGGKYWPSWEK